MIQYQTIPPDERLAVILMAIKNVMESLRDTTWFISFGALRWFVTDRLLNKKFNQDIDISLFYDKTNHIELQQSFEQYGYKLQRKIINPKDNNKPFQMVYSPITGGNIEIDIYFWVKANGYYWHTYDIAHTNEEVLSEYVFKGIRADIFEQGVADYTWEDTVGTMKFPKAIGQCLDTWYPPRKNPDGSYIADSGWFIEDKKYGQSRSEKVVVIKDLSKMMEELK